MSSTADAARWIRWSLTSAYRRLEHAASVRLPNAAVRTRLKEVLTEGGLAQDCALLPTAACTQRIARLLIQIDGDMMLSLPRDFGSQTEDAARVAGLHSAMATELQSLHDALPYNLAALISLLLPAVCSLTIAGGAGTLTFDWQRELAATLSIWQQRAPGLPGTAAALWHVLVIFWPLIASIAGLLGLTFGRAVRFAITRGVIWLVSRRMGRRTWP